MFRSKVYEFANQHIKEYLGGITDFLAAKKIACFREYEQLHKPKGNGISNDEAEREVSENKLSFEERKQLNKEIRKAEQRVERAEQRVTELESEVAALEKQMAAGVVNDELLKKYGETQKELEEAMTEWEKATEEEEEVKNTNIIKMIKVIKLICVVLVGYFIVRVMFPSLMPLKINTNIAFVAAVAGIVVYIFSDKVPDTGMESRLLNMR